MVTHGWQQGNKGDKRVIKPKQEFDPEEAIFPQISALVTQQASISS